MSRPRAPFGPEQSALLDEFTERWDLGESPRIEEFLGRIDPSSVELAVELIYRQFCLEEADGSQPSSATYLDQFAAYREPLGRLFRLHEAVSGSQVRRWARLAGSEGIDDPFSPYEPELPTVGNQIGPFLLIRELGEGAFARVFLAQQTDLENRQVVIKVSSRPSREPWLLARARHPHIVEIISQFEVDGGALQLICMPFWGGATLFRLMDEVRRRVKRPTSGRELLSDLDAVAASEYPASQRSRTSRDIVAGSSFDQALAWLVARLAEALDYASSRKVAHGDIKPSNILISADATPMLLDFNLAQDWAQDDEDLGPIDRGGTLAYMAPERLRAVADLDGFASPSKSISDPHPADLYSLGMVFLEMLSDRAPIVPKEIEPVPKGRHEAAASFRRSAGRLAELRSQTPPREMIRKVAGTRIPPTLCSILACCLEPDPARRYQRGQDLARDLDRWRTDRPLVVAQEDRFHATCRQIRRARHPIMAMAAVVFVAVTVGIGVSLSLNARAIAILKTLGIEKIANLWDAHETRAFGFLRIPIAGELKELSYTPIGTPADFQPERSAKPRPEVQSKSMEIATLALKDYQLLAAPNWRDRPDVRNLPQAEREDLELWLMEQAYRYCHELASRPDSPDDWERALAALNHLIPTAPLTVFTQLKTCLERELAELSARQNGLRMLTPHAEPATLTANDLDLAPPWLDEYLLGVALECELNGQMLPFVAAIDGPAGSPKEKILAHYQKTLSHRPDSFWAHYRAAVICKQLDRSIDRSAHLNFCLLKRPENAAIRGRYAGSLFGQNRLGEALTESDKATALDPDYAEYYRTRAFVAAKLGRSEQARDDLHRFEILSRVIPSNLLKSRFHPDRVHMELNPEDLQLSLDKRRPVSTATDSESWLPNQRARLDADDLGTRLSLAQAIFDNAGDNDLVMAELNKILLIDPGYLHARIFRVKLLVHSGAFEEVRRDLDKIFKHPELDDFIRDHEDVVPRFVDVSWKYMKHGRNDEAISLANKILTFAESAPAHLGLAHYTMARANASVGKNTPGIISMVVDHLRKASARNKRYLAWYKQDRSFQSIRTRVDEALKRTPEGESPSSAVQAALSQSGPHVSH